MSGSASILPKSMIPVDITMLAWPGWRGMLARRRWSIRYGIDDLKKFQARAEERHQRWTERGCQFTLVKSFTTPAHTYVCAICSQHGYNVDDRGFCSKC